jgi:hypothetical protein
VRLFSPPRAIASSGLHLAGPATHVAIKLRLAHATLDGSRLRCASVSLCLLSHSQDVRGAAARERLRSWLGSPAELAISRWRPNRCSANGILERGERQWRDARVAYASLSVSLSHDVAGRPPQADQDPGTPSPASLASAAGDRPADAQTSAGDRAAAAGRWFEHACLSLSLSSGRERDRDRDREKVAARPKATGRLSNSAGTRQNLGDLLVMVSGPVSVCLIAAYFVDLAGFSRLHMLTG